MHLKNLSNTNGLLTPIDSKILRNYGTKQDTEADAVELAGKNDDSEQNSTGDELEIEPFYSKFNIKDTGYAWVPVIAMFFSNALTTGYIKCFGIIFNAIRDNNPEISVTMAGVMMSLLSGCRCIFAPLAGTIGNIIGIRRAMGLGATLCSGALVGAYFCSSAAGYAITLGAISGLGQCVLEATHVITVSQYFNKKISSANGIRVAGNPFGGVVYPIMFAFLLDTYGIPSLFLVLAGIMTQIYICAALFRPIDIHLRICSLSYIKNYFSKDSPEKRSLFKKQYENTSQEKRQLMLNLMALYPSITNKKKKPLEFSFLSNPVFLLFLVMAIGVPMALPLVSYYMAIYARNVLFLSVFEISLLVSIQCLADVFIRILLGQLNSKRFYKLTHGYSFFLLLSGAASFLVPFTWDFYSLLFVNFFCSFGANSFHTFVSVILIEQFGKESIATTYGFVRMVQGIFSLIHPIVIGYIVDVTEGFMIPFFVMGSGLLFSSLVILMEPLVIKFTKSEVIIT